MVATFWVVVQAVMRLVSPCLVLLLLLHVLGEAICVAKEVHLSLRLYVSTLPVFLLLLLLVFRS